MVSLFGHEDVSTRLETLAYALIAIGMASTLLGFVLWPVFGQPFWPLWSLAPFGAYGAYMLSVGYNNPIPNTPPSKALLTIWGERLPIILKEGQAFFADFYPFKISRVLVVVEKKNHDFIYSGIRCRRETPEDDAKPGKKEGDPRKEKVGRPHSGGAITVKGSWTFGPNTSSGQNVLDYLNAGSREGVIDQMEDIFGAAIRAVATERTWEEVTFLESALAAAIAVKVTGAKILKLPRAGKTAPDNEKLAPMNTWPHGERYRKIANRRNISVDDLIEDPVDYIDDLQISREERTNRQKEIEWFLKQALVDGVADVHGVGSEVTRISITDVEPEGKLKEDAEAASREYQQRKRDNMDTETGLQLAKQYLKAASKNGEKMSVTEAMRLAQSDRGRAEQIYVNSNTDNPLVTAAAVNGRRKKS